MVLPLQEIKKYEEEENRKLISRQEEEIRLRTIFLKERNKQFRPKIIILGKNNQNIPAETKKNI